MKEAIFIVFTCHVAFCLHDIYSPAFHTWYPNGVKYELDKLFGSPNITFSLIQMNVTTSSNNNM